MTIYDVIIIGAGPAGMTAAIYAVRKGLHVFVIGETIGGQVAKSGEIENYLGFGQTNGAELAMKFHEHIEKFDRIEHIHSVPVTDIRQNGKIFFVLTGKEKYSTRALIIASGRKPRELEVPGENEYKNKGVSYCEVCDAPLFRGKKTVVVGGGNSGLEAAFSLSQIASSVIVINIGKKLTGDSILIKKVLQQKNVTVVHEARTVEIKGDQTVTGIVIENLKSGKQKTIQTQGVFVEIGYVPNVDFDNLTKKDEQNRIKITRNNETHIPGLFACGDVSDIRDNQVIIASGEGAKAALSAYYYLIRKR